MQRSLARHRWLIGSGLTLVTLMGAGLAAFATPVPTPTHSLISEPSSVPMSMALQDSLLVNQIASLENTLWQLTSYINEAGDLQSVLPDTTPTLQLAADRISGNGSCNRYFGSYSLTSDRLSIETGGATMMACLPEIMQQEQAFWAALDQVATYSFNDAGNLQLQDNEGQVLLTFQAFVSPPLAGTLWELEHYNNGRGGLASAIAGSQITVRFDEAGQMAGTAGCNRYTARYEATPDQLSLTPIASTKRLCAHPDGVMEQESAYLQALATVATYEIEANQLTLRNSAGTVMARFRAGGNETMP